MISDGDQKASEMMDGHADVPTVQVTGEIDVATSPELRQTLLDPSLDPSGTLVVDMLTVTFLDSTGLGALVEGHNRFQSAGGTLRMVIANPHVLRVLQVTALDQTFSIFPSVAAAKETASA
jgi:anti-sigma B factor antagonist